MMKLICATIKEINSEKASGPDGFPGLFYTTYWEIIKEDVVSLATNFFTLGILWPRLNETNIVLMPKSNSPAKLNDYCWCEISL